MEAAPRGRQPLRFAPPAMAGLRLDPDLEDTPDKAAPRTRQPRLAPSHAPAQAASHLCAGEAGGCPDADGRGHALLSVLDAAADGAVAQPHIKLTAVQQPSSMPAGPQPQGQGAGPAKPRSVQTTLFFAIPKVRGATQATLSAASGTSPSAHWYSILLSVGLSSASCRAPVLPTGEADAAGRATSNAPAPHRAASSCIHSSGRYSRPRTRPGRIASPCAGAQRLVCGRRLHS